MTIKHHMEAGNLYFTITGSPNPDKPELNRFEDKKLIMKARKYEDTKA